VEIGSQAGKYSGGAFAGKRASTGAVRQTPDNKKPAINAGFLQDLVGRGKLNRIGSFLIFIGNFLLEIYAEYLLEYQRFPQVAGIFSDIPANCLDKAEAIPPSQR
jgi:hypothetical protein